MVVNCVKWNVNSRYLDSSLEKIDLSGAELKAKGLKLLEK